MSTMKSHRQRIEALEKELGATALVSPFIMAQSREDVDRQARQFATEHPDFNTALFVMIGPAVETAP